MLFNTHMKEKLKQFYATTVSDLNCFHVSRCTSPFLASPSSRLHSCVPEFTAVCLSVCLPVFLHVCLPVCLSVLLHFKALRRCLICLLPLELLRLPISIVSAPTVKARMCTNVFLTGSTAHSFDSGCYLVLSGFWKQIQMYSTKRVTRKTLSIMSNK